ncbi:nascent polypeptide-associated complex subunit alpha, muscle-specific form-like [Cynocephalus volans]|uniref:nascent polypeptide-associated complex subunit alpha, muscle-specific form-like n=1 Tax=Cynocephalus volans TaxID=110931 RepID=UPI002FC63120
MEHPGKAMPASPSLRDRSPDSPPTTIVRRLSLTETPPSRPAAGPGLVQVSPAGGRLEPGRPLTLQVPRLPLRSPSDSPPRRSGQESRVEDAQVPGPVRGRRRDRTRMRGSREDRVAASSARANFLRDAGRQGAPLGSAFRWPGPGSGPRDGGSSRPSYLAAPRQLQLSARLDAAPGPSSASKLAATQPARLLNESPAGPGDAQPRPRASRPPAPPPTSESGGRPSPPTPRAVEGLVSLPPGRTALRRHLSRPLRTAGGCAGPGGGTQGASAPSGLHTRKKRGAMQDEETGDLDAPRVLPPLPV